jgi:sugar lactone lactonase YvrE
MVGRRLPGVVPTLARAAAALALTLGYAVAALAQGTGQPADPRRTAGVWAPADSHRAAFLASHCRNPPPAGAAVQAGPRRGGPPPFQDIAATEIPGVIAAGQHWKVVWEDPGNGADGIVGFDDGSVWIALTDRSEVVRVDRHGKASVIYTDTYTGSALAANSKGQVFVAERSLGNAVWMLEPQRRLLADTYHGEPFDCAGRFINDVLADGKGGVYMTMDGLYYINRQGAVAGPFGSVPGNGLMLSPDEKTFYATGRLAGDTAGRAAGDGIYNAGLVAYDVQPDGSLTHERQLAELCGDGLAVDAQGRIYCALARVPDPADPTKKIAGIGVVSPEGKVLGIIPQPRPLVTIAFGGPDKHTLFAAVSRPIQLLSVPMIARGNRKRPK